MTQFPLSLQRAVEHAGLIDPTYTTEATGAVTITDVTGRIVRYAGSQMRELTPLAAA